MAEYINREALLKRLCDDDPSHMEDYYYNAIADAPTADMVEVVRCKDCKYWARKGSDPILNTDFGICMHQQWQNSRDLDIETDSQDYCSYREKRIENNE